MNREAIKHVPKSQMAYAFDENTLHLYLQTAKNDVKSVELIIGDPFDWHVVNGEYVWSGKNMNHQRMQKLYSTDLFDYYFIESFPQYKRSKYAFLIHSENELYFYGCRELRKLESELDHLVVDDLFGYFNYPYINKEDLIDSPSWSKNMIWYQIFPDRFHKSKDKIGEYLPFGSVTEGLTNHMYFGGDLRGVLEKIGYLKDLGVTGIYFTPIFKAHSAHKYDTEDYFLVDPSFGTNADLKALILACHESGIKVMLDAVFNHCGWDHPYFQDVIKNKKNSPYWNCFFIEDEEFVDFPLDDNGRPIRGHYPLKFRTFAKTPMMPKWNTSDPIAESYLLEVATYWVREYDIDGWRLDVSNEVSHRFWRKFKLAVRDIKPDLFILGENWDDSTPWLKGDQFDAVMNYEIAYPLWKFFGKYKNPFPSNSESFVSSINKLLLSYPKNIASQMFNLVDSHDTMRILTRCDHNPELMKLCYLFVFVFCGSPAIYYGDEIGLEGKEDPDSRRCMIWNPNQQNLDLYAYFKRMIQLKKTIEAFHEVDITWHYAKENVLLFQKKSVLIAINNNAEEKTIPLEIIFAGKKGFDLYAEKSIQLSSYFTLPPYGFCLIQLI